MPTGSTRIAAIAAARHSVREAIASFGDKPPASLVKDAASASLESRGFSPDHAADLVALVWENEFEIKGAN